MRLCPSPILSVITCQVKAWIWDILLVCNLLLSYISSGTSLLSPDACLVQALLPSMPVWIRIPSAWRGPPSLGCSRPKCHDPELFSCLHNHSRNHPDAPVKTNTRKKTSKVGSACINLSMRLSRVSQLVSQLVRLRLTFM